MSLEELGRHVVEFVRAHESWAAPIAFALAFAESLAFVSLILPSWAALVGIGALMKEGGLGFAPVWCAAVVGMGALMTPGGLEFVQVWIAAAIGAALGDWLSYWIGTKFRHSVARTWPFSHHPHLLLRGEAFIKNWGGLAIFMGRFSGPLRASVPVAAGIFGMPYWRFQLAN